MDREILKQMKWSYSRLNSFYTCKLMWFKTYVLKEKGQDNAFGQHGTFVHELLERYAKGELLPFLLVDDYIENYAKKVTEDFPPNKFVNLRESYFNKGKEYLQNFDGFSNYELLEPEKKVEFSIGDYNFIGYIDQPVKNEDGDLEVIDNKSASFKNKSKKAIKEYWKQLYLYSIPLKDEYDKYPVKLNLNAFQDQRWLEEYFDKKELEKAKQWALDTIELIAQEEEFEGTYVQFFCNYICSYRNSNCSCKLKHESK